MWVLIGLFQGVSSETLDEKHRVFPNQGIYRSAHNGLLLGLISGVISGLVYIFSFLLSRGIGHGLGYALSNERSNGWGYWISYWWGALFSHDALGGLLLTGLLIAVASGLLSCIFSGGLAWWQHTILRFLLQRSKSIPWNYPSFLDEAARHILLRKVGGGYTFIHRLFLDYVADQASRDG